LVLHDKESDHKVRATNEIEEKAMSFNTVSVIGLGYIGLPTAAIIASNGINVIGVDINKHTVETINKGEIHIVEHDLDIAVRNAVQTGMLKAIITPEPADAFIITVPTPLKKNHQPDLSYIKAAAIAIAAVLEKGNLIVLESTSPVGSTLKLERWLAKERPDLTFPTNGGENIDINLAYCPERVLPGNILQELVTNDRVVGGLTIDCAIKAKSLYDIFVKGECHITNTRTAEMTKLTENAYRDVNIAFANELSLICDELDVNVWNLIRLANRHPRVSILKPGPGVGGHCIAIDPWFIIDSAPKISKLIRVARDVNDNKSEWVIQKVIEAAEGIDNPKIACLGLSFKANIGDLRESPAVKIVASLAKGQFGNLLIAEPFIKKLPSLLEDLPNAKLVTVNEALENSNIIVMLVNHRAFKECSSLLLENKTIIDTQGFWKQS